MKELVFNGWGQWFNADISGSTTYELGSDYECVGRFAMSDDDELKYDNGFIKDKDLTRLYPCLHPKCHFKELITIFHNGEFSEYAAFNSASEDSLPITHADFPTFLINRDKEFKINIKEYSEKPSEITVKETTTAPIIKEEKPSGKIITIERELTKWMRETWVNEGKLGGTAFFNKLKSYVNKENSPIREHFTTSSKGAGIRWITGGTTNTMSKKAIVNKVCIFKKTP